MVLVGINICKEVDADRQVVFLSVLAHQNPLVMMTEVGMFMWSLF